MNRNDPRYGRGKGNISKKYYENRAKLDKIWQKKPNGTKRNVAERTAQKQDVA